MAPSSPLERVPLDPHVRSFFHAIKENPDDDPPRLIFADWLQEHGNAADAARGEYLRLSVLRHRLSPDDPSFELMKRREGELFREHCWAWLGPLGDAAKSWKFERGMIQITAQARNLNTPVVRAWTQTPAALWVDAMALSELVDADVPEFRFFPLLAEINCLDLSSNGQSRAFNALFQALNGERPRFLSNLCLARCRVESGHIHSFLALCFHLRNLRILDLRYNRLDDAAARFLADSPYLKNLAELRLGHNRFKKKGMTLLRQAFGDRVHF